MHEVREQRSEESGGLASGLLVTRLATEKSHMSKLRGWTWKTWASWAHGRCTRPGGKMVSCSEVFSFDAKLGRRHIELFLSIITAAHFAHCQGRARRRLIFKKGKPRDGLCFVKLSAGSITRAFHDVPARGLLVREGSTHTFAAWDLG